MDEHQRRFLDIYSAVVNGCETIRQYDETQAMGNNHPYAQVQCLFCQTGHEQAVALHLSRTKCVFALAATKIKKEWRHGAWEEVQKVLLPGYVFLYLNDDRPIQMADINFSKILRILEYGDGSTFLTGYDRGFADWLWKHKGVIGLSKVAQCGDEVKIVSGPLAEIGGVITKIDKRRQIAKILLNAVGGPSVWLSFDFVECIEKTSAQ